MANAVPVVHKACAACKHQRRRCDANFELAKYFTAEKADDFEDVYHLYGMQNTLKILKSAEEEERDQTIESLIMEAMRLEYPVHDHFSVARKLSIKIDKAERELEIVRKQKSSSLEDRITGPARQPAVKGSPVNHECITK